MWLGLNFFKAHCRSENVIFYIKLKKSIIVDYIPLDPGRRECRNECHEWYVVLDSCSQLRQLTPLHCHLTLSPVTHHVSQTVVLPVQLIASTFNSPQIKLLAYCFLQISSWEPDNEHSGTCHQLPWFCYKSSTSRQHQYQYTMRYTLKPHGFPPIPINSILPVLVTWITVNKTRHFLPQW